MKTKCYVCVCVCVLMINITQDHLENGKRLAALKQNMKKQGLTQDFS